MGPGLTETFDTPDYLKEAGIEYVADFPMDDQPFEVRTEYGPLVSIPYTVELNDIPMMSSSTIKRKNSTTAAWIISNVCIRKAKTMPV